MYKVLFREELAELSYILLVPMSYLSQVLHIVTCVGTLLKRHLSIKVLELASLVVTHGQDEVLLKRS